MFACEGSGRGGARWLGFLGSVAALTGRRDSHEPWPRDTRGRDRIGDPMSHTRLLLADEDQTTRTFLAVIRRC
jgi:hypothetical protein